MFLGIIMEIAQRSKTYSNTIQKKRKRRKQRRKQSKRIQKDFRIHYRLSKYNVRAAETKLNILELSKALMTPEGEKSFSNCQYKNY